MTTFFAILLVATLALSYKFEVWQTRDDNLFIHILKILRLGFIIIIILFSILAVSIGPSIEKETAEEKKIELQAKKKEAERASSEKEASSVAESKRKEEAKEIEKTEKAHEQVSKEASRNEVEQSMLKQLQESFQGASTVELMEYGKGVKAFRVTPTTPETIEAIKSVPTSADSLREWKNVLVPSVQNLSSTVSKNMPSDVTYIVTLVNPDNVNNDLLTVSHGTVTYDFASEYEL